MSISNKQELTIHCGKATNSFEELKALCEGQRIFQVGKLSFKRIA